MDLELQRLVCSEIGRNPLIEPKPKLLFIFGILRLLRFLSPRTNDQRAMKQQHEQPGSISTSHLNVLLRPAEILNRTV